MEAHPITAFTTRLHQVLDEVLAGSAAGLSGASAGDTAVLVARAEARLSALRLKLLEQAQREDGCSGQQAVSEGWWAQAASVEHRRSRKDFRLARELGGDFHRTEAALAAGQVTAAQAEVIVDAVRALPASVGPEGREKAELHLLEQAAEFNPKQLRVLAKHLVDVVDPTPPTNAWPRRWLPRSAGLHVTASCRSSPTSGVSPTCGVRSRLWSVTSC